ncbi:hypothetical protein EXIGLDRAFT_787744 [Exidia glandulosa HHB12029]|uniref:Uncharacterized protein n=1 Tax=Exidia glandulosa HHB12029 TaxID=1314781 RepID=A0A165IKX3_EXIGL|nr:hypothetical protein EXIGLDRAFT_787744 [Exidia glandulosa HHB12029]
MYAKIEVPSFNKSAGSRCFIDNGENAFTETKRKRDRDRRRKYVYPGIPDRINIYHINTAQLVMAYEDESLGDVDNTVDRNYGLVDLYIDPHHPDHDHIESKLSRLEGDAAAVIRSLVESLDSPSSRIRIQRRDLNTLRKFLFIMSYRGERRGQQFFEDRFDTGTRRDIDAHIAKYLHPGATARDVWLQNIKEILDTDYWAIPENPRVFVHDRMECEMDMRMKRIVFWRTRGAEEFITCANGWGFMDGVFIDSSSHAGGPEDEEMMARIMRENGSVFDPSAPRHGAQGTFPWIRIFPLHPRLSIALVSTFLNPVDPSTPIPPYLRAAPARYRDLPMPPCSDTDYHGLSVSAQAARRRQDAAAFTKLRRRTASFYPATEIDGKLMESRVEDVFTFPITPLTTAHTHRVNAMFLENAAGAITFCSPAQLYRSILAYEASDIWDHKKDYTALKARLGLSFATRTHLAFHPQRVLPEILRSGSAEERAKKRMFGLLNRCHDDSLFRNEESAAAARKNASDLLTTSASKRVGTPRKGAREAGESPSSAVPLTMPGRNATAASTEVIRVEEADGAQGRSAGPPSAAAPGSAKGPSLEDDTDVRSRSVYLNPFRVWNNAAAAWIFPKG